ncbi:hypothetical protein, partial [Gilvimarinus sp. 1_MG-2023]|uniref:hypothetical protein n=1 Tax=Gilvimarinus sp. 1_MG-2023 TaxID=3062638 RepID=UPI0026E2B788
NKHTNKAEQIVIGDCFLLAPGKIAHGNKKSSNKNKNPEQSLHFNRAIVSYDPAFKKAQENNDAHHAVGQDRLRRNIHAQLGDV